MMKSKYLFILFLLLVSCKSEDNTLYEFDPMNLQQNEIRLSEISDDIKYIPLDNTYNLGLIYEKIEFISNSIYLSEKDIGVMVFNRNGKFLRKIGSKGRGPGEYIYNYLFAIDDKTETVYILDNGDMIKVFSGSGEFLRSFSLREYGQGTDAIEIYDSKLFVSYLIQEKNNRYRWIFVDSTGNLIKKEERKIPAFSSRVFGDGGTYIYDNQLSYWNCFYTDTVFSIFPDLNEKPSFLINVGEYRYPKSMVLIPIEESDKLFFLKQIIEVKHFQIIRYSINRNKGLAIIEKENRKTYLTDWDYDGSGGLINDLDDGFSFLPKYYFLENGREYLVALQHPYQIKAHVTSDEFNNSIPKYPEKKKELEKLAASLNEMDNPVLVLVRLKN